MISEIDFTDISKSESFAYASKLDFFQQNQMMQFTPGVNVIFAPNGSGKSTLLKIMALFTASEQGGKSTYTSSWQHDVYGFNKNKLDGLKVAHDGQPVLYTNPRNAVGLVGGMAGFDDDFFEQGIMEATNKSSTGLTTISRMGHIIETLAGNRAFPDKIEQKVYALDEKVQAIIAPSIDVGNRTILLDEPESGLAIHVQEKIWQMIAKGAKDHNYQIIVATHSPFSLTLDANFIELMPGYIEIAKHSIRNMVSILDLVDEMKRDEKKKMKP